MVVREPKGSRTISIVHSISLHSMSSLAFLIVVLPPCPCICLKSIFGESQSITDGATAAKLQNPINAIHADRYTNIKE